MTIDVPWPIMSDENTTPIDASTTPNADPQPDLLSKIQHATDRAIDQHNAETKRKPGQRGPDKAPRKRPVSLGRVADVPSSPLLDPNQETPALDAAAVPGLPLDEDTIKAVADLGVEGFKFVRETINKVAAYKMTGDRAVAEHACPEIPPKLETSLTSAAVLCSRDLASRVLITPWTMLGF